MPAPALRDVQASFWRSLHSGVVAPELAAVVLPSATLEPAARVAIYQDMYVWRLHEVLREDYPKTYEALGDEFADVVRRYVTAHPSEHPSVRHLGGRLPAFLADDPATRSRAWLPGLARLERARVDVFDAPDDVPLRAGDLRAVPPEDWAGLAFGSIAALRVVRADHPVHETWASPAAAAVPERPTVLRVWRQEYGVFHVAMDPVEAGAFEVFRAGAPFAAVCEAVAEHVPPDEAAGQAGALLARWLEDGLAAHIAS